MKKNAKLNLILNLVRINMKKTRIEITHQIENETHFFKVQYPNSLSQME
jgi:hypothetical protein